MNAPPGKEVGLYIFTYNNERPHQNLWNFTPAYVHSVNNNFLLFTERTGTAKTCNTVTEKRILGAPTIGKFEYKKRLTKLYNFV